MVERTKLEINIRRLLSRCELSAKKDVNIDWKLEQYVESLHNMIEDLQKLPHSDKPGIPGKPSRDVMISYIRRVEFLKGLLATKKLPDPVERAVAAQMLPASIITSNDSVNGISIATQIHQKTTAKYGEEIRKELFGSAPDIKEGLKQRLLEANGKNENLDSLINHNRERQDKVAEHMYLMTKTMKEHALTASEIIKKDLTALEKTDKLTDSNTAKLQTESSTLENHTKSTWRCWQILMLAFVIVVFINMVLFMKVTRKKIKSEL